MLRHTFRTLALLGLVVLFQFGCTSAATSDTSGTTILYVYDATTNEVLAWDSISTLFSSGSASPDRTITSSKLSSFTLAWGGMALDSNAQYLYLVSTDGTVVRISQIGDQSGAVASSDVISFTLDDSDTSISSGVFGQAAVTPDGSMLYVTECASSSGGTSQIWAIPLSSMSSGASFGESYAVATTSGLGGDKSGTGVAASSSYLFAYFNTGDTTVSSTEYTGARLRRGTTSGSFATSSSLIAGASGNTTTLLGKYGCLAYDTDNDYLYVARHNTDAGTTAGSSPLLLFKPGDFGGSIEVAPDATFTGPDDLRIIAHAGKKDWLVGALSGPASTLWIWKGLAGSGSYVSFDLPDTSSGAVEIKGLALDGSD